MHTTGDQFGRPIQGQKEISGFKTIDPGNEWKAMVSVSLQAVGSFLLAQKLKSLISPHFTYFMKNTESVEGHKEKPN